MGATDEGFMMLALELARGQLGRTAPNPSVGCVVVKRGAVIAAAATGDGGRPHAEEAALEAAGTGAEDSVVYVTLEPCSQRTSGAPSCADRLAAGRPSRIVIACEDPNPAAAHGAALLRDRGFTVSLGVCREAAQELNAGFFKRLLTGRPLVTIAANAAGHDALFALEPGETAEAALDRLGAAGLTRLWARFDSPEAAMLKAQGLVDRHEP